MNFDKERILVTGGSGFLGKELVKRLPECEVPSRQELPLTDWLETEDFLDMTHSRLIFHLAARCGGIGANAAYSAEMFLDNLEMGTNLVECAPAFSSIVLVGSTCSYPSEPPNYPFREDEFWMGYPHESNAPYGIAKKALWTYAKACNIRFVYPILANLYGPGFRDDHVIPDLIRKFVEAKREGTKEVVLWGDGTPERDFLHVSDAADALIFLAAHAPDEWWQGELVNIGSGISLQIHEVARIIRALVDCPTEIVWDKSRPNGQMRRRLDTSKMRSIGWKAKKAFLPGLKETVEWYLSQESDNDG